MVPEPVPKPGTRNRFLNIVSLTHCALYESLFVKNESRNIGLKLMRLSFHFFIHSFIHLFVAFISSQILNSVQAARISSTSMNL